MRKLGAGLVFYLASFLALPAQYTYSWSTFTTTNSGLPDNLVTSLRYTPDTLWVGTAAGLAYVVDSVVSHATDFPDYYITCLDADEQGNLWIGTAANGCYQRLGPGNYTAYTSTPGELTSDQVLAVHCDGDSTWIGTDGDGIFLLYNNNWTRIHSGNHPLGWSVDQVYSITTDAQHRVWFGTSGTGVVRKPVSGPYWKFDPDSSLRYSWVRKILLQGDSLLWIGMGNTAGDSGLARLYLPSSNLYHYCDTGGNTFVQQNVWDILIDAQNRKWIASNQINHGLLLYNDTVFTAFDQFTSGLLSNRTYALAQDDAEKIWVGSFYGLSVNQVISTLQAPAADDYLYAHIYPNPVRDQLTLQYASLTGQPCRLWITDLQGRNIWEQENTAPQNTAGILNLDAMDWPPGMYLLRIQAGGMYNTMKIIKL